MQYHWLFGNESTGSFMDENKTTKQPTSPPPPASPHPTPPTPTAPTPMSSKLPPLPLWRRILLALILAAIVLLCGLMAMNFIVERQLGGEIARISRAVEPVTFSELRPGTPTEANDVAATSYIQAIVTVNPNNLAILKQLNAFYRKNIDSLPANQFPADARERAAQLLGEYRQAFEKIDDAAGLSMGQFDIGVQKGLQVYAANLQRVQTIVFLLSLRTLDLLVAGQGDQAAESIVSTLKIMRTIDTHPVMVLHVGKIAFLTLACEDVRILLEHGSVGEQSLQLLQQALSQSFPDDALERSFLTERVYQIEMARYLLPAAITKKYLPAQAPDIPERIALPASRWAQMRLRYQSVRYFRYMAALLTAVRQPWPKRLDAAIGLADPATKKKGGVLLTGAQLARFTAETSAIVHCTIAALSVQRYHLAQNKLPASLDDLVPAYIDSVPIDPFTGGKLLYRFDEEAYVVYSTGINRLDDNGNLQPTEDQTTTLDRGVRIRIAKSG